ncbi:VOC family protein [Tetragenococcus halophilus subsp. flandriensis]|uniref:VOC family protein n=1 Tax=Tetragenococcus halophilus TaxID=51669 RepID=UPI0023EA2C17|nr:VOC family protein [Tetragenococcus halophilus]GMA08584.1 VOC family protein [Tetragenococcus halophilus subsp. flandriensis]
MQKIVTNLWFDTQAEEAAKFYTSLFEDGDIHNITYYGPSGAKVSGMPEGTVLTVEFSLADQEYIAINGGPVFKFTPAISLMVNCDTQEEIDRLWEAFCEEGQPEECGWLTDKYGLSWQIVPSELNELLSNPDPEKVENVNRALFSMKKLDIEQLRKAAMK